MSSLHPTFWRTCRVLANEIRLKLLWRLFEKGQASMGELAVSVGIGESTASSGLRALNSRGLISAERRGLYVFYQPGANPEVEHSELILSVLRKCYEEVVPFKHIMFSATAFTHPRRIDIVQALQDGVFDEPELSMKTQISVPALQRHLRKLIARGFVVKAEGKYQLLEQTGEPMNSFLKVALG